MELQMKKLIDEELEIQRREEAERLKKQQELEEE